MRRNFSGTREVSGSCVGLRVNRCLFASRSGTLHSDVAQRRIKCWNFRLAKIEYLRGEAPRARARLHKHEFRRAPEAFPHLRELPCQQSRKNGMHIDTGVIIGEAFGFRFAVIAVRRMVEAFAHVVRERDGAEAANAVGQ